MKVYTYSEARDQLARVLEEAKTYGAVRIKRQDGSEFTVRPVSPAGSPLDVDGVDTDITSDELLAAIREGRDRDPSPGSVA